MGLILDSSIVIAAERRGDSPERLLKGILAIYPDQEIALTTVGLAEIAHGIYRANDEVRRTRREKFITTLLEGVSLYPFTKEAAFVAGRLDAERQLQGINVPYADLLIAATALSLGFSVITTNLRDFQRIPELRVLKF